MRAFGLSASIWCLCLMDRSETHKVCGVQCSAYTAVSMGMVGTWGRWGSGDGGDVASYSEEITIIINVWRQVYQKSTWIYYAVNFHHCR